MKFSDFLKELEAYGLVDVRGPLPEGDVTASFFHTSAAREQDHLVTCIHLLEHGNLHFCLAEDQMED